METNTETDPKQKRPKACAIYLDHHLIKYNLLLSLEKLTLKELNPISISRKITYPLHGSILTLIPKLKFRLEINIPSAEKDS